MAQLSYIQNSLSPKDFRFIKNAGTLASRSGVDLFLVGGCVRDMLLSMPIKDFDIVADAPLDQIIEIFTHSSDAEVVSRSQFETAKLRCKDGRIVDLAITRKEIYEQPGSLPKVERSSIEEDLWRRDFSINAIGIQLNPLSFGEVVDPTGGRNDLTNCTIRVLHINSFKDDPTRIIRGIRYAERLRFKFEETTLNLLRGEAPNFKIISENRIRSELEKIINEEAITSCLKMAHKLGVLSRVDPAFGHPDILKAINLIPKVPSTIPQILAVLTYEYTNAETGTLVRRQNLTSAEQKIIADSKKIRSMEHNLAEKSLMPSLICKALDGMSAESLLAACFLAKIRLTRQRIYRFLISWRHIRPVLNGTDVIRLGVPKGPMVGEILNALRLKLIDRQIKSRSAQEAYVRYMAKNSTTKSINSR